MSDREVRVVPPLKSRKWERFLRGPDKSLLDELYLPALASAVRYDRCCAYFCSRVLAVAARGYGEFITNLMSLGEAAPKPAARLLVNEQLDAEDLDALLASGDRSALVTKLLKQFKSPSGALEKQRLQMLAWLVSSGLLEVRVGIMRKGQGMLHAKFGVVTDQAGDKLAFMGSDNETGEALSSNYEELELRPSWEDADFCSNYQERFDSLWNDQDPDVRVLSLPAAVREKLIKLAPKEPPVVEPLASKETLVASMVWNYIAAAPYQPGGEYSSDASAMVDLWPHQRKVVEDTAKAYPAGRLLCDEVGMGKTIEAALVLRRLLLGRGVKRALLLVPAGLLAQWQDELREKGGLLVPRWDSGFLVRPGHTREQMTAADALRRCDLLLLSREWARLKDNKDVVLGSPPWDLVLLDEAHAARRREPEETQFNSGNLLLELIRDLQLAKRTRGILLLSATPMQTEPWEPWDLLTTLGVGGPWMVEFGDIRTYYGGLAALEHSSLKMQDAGVIAGIADADGEFPAPPAALGAAPAADAIRNLPFAMPGRRRAAADWLRTAAPLGRRMHRNTRETLREYHTRGLLKSAPPDRQVADEVFDYGDPRERDVYDSVQTYIDQRYEQLEQERAGKGFVMTIYRRRASSAPYAIRRSLERRRDKLESVIRREYSDVWLVPQDEDVDIQDLADQDIDRIDPALPQSPAAARAEKQDIEALLARLDDLGPTDSKLEKFWSVLADITADGRSALVFTEYADTMQYLRDQLRPTYGTALGCYSGAGGQVWDGAKWVQVSKAEITSRLFAGDLKVLVCTDAASEGLNLQAASALVNYDLPWNPSKVEQRIGRIDRIGQEQRDLPIRNMFLKDSVDMRVYQALRLRCGLFEHFVGPMQPVLQLARKALRENLRPQGVDTLVHTIEQEASQARQDTLVNSAFASSPAVDVQVQEAAVTRSEMAQALEQLCKCEGKVSVRKVPKKPLWKLRIAGKAAVEVTLDRETLERDAKAVPLMPGLGLTREVSARLPLGANLPLVVAEAASGAFRCSEVRWVSATGHKPVTSLRQLRALIDTWDGSAPKPERVSAAENEARKAASRRLKEMAERADQAAQTGLDNQLEAAQRRLKRELARTLRCMGRTDLTALLRQQAEREPAAGGRFRRALQLLQGDPKWTPEEVREADTFVGALSTSARLSRVTFTEIDAALNDPRWRALGTE